MPKSKLPTPVKGWSRKTRQGVKIGELQVYIGHNGPETGSNCPEQGTGRS